MPYLLVSVIYFRLWKFMALFIHSESFLKSSKFTGIWVEICVEKKSSESISGQNCNIPTIKKNCTENGNLNRMKMNLKLFHFSLIKRKHFQGFFSLQTVFLSLQEAHKILTVSHSKCSLRKFDFKIRKSIAQKANLASNSVFSAVQVGSTVILAFS